MTTNNTSSSSPASSSPVILRDALRKAIEARIRETGEVPARLDDSPAESSSWPAD